MDRRRESLCQDMHDKDSKENDLNFSLDEKRRRIGKRGKSVGQKSVTAKNRDSSREDSNSRRNLNSSSVLPSISPSIFADEEKKRQEQKSMFSDILSSSSVMKKLNVTQMDEVITNRKFPGIKVNHKTEPPSDLAQSFDTTTSQIPPLKID